MTSILLGSIVMLVAVTRYAVRPRTAHRDVPSYALVQTVSPYQRLLLKAIKTRDEAIRERDTRADVLHGRIRVLEHELTWLRQLNAERVVGRADQFQEQMFGVLEANAQLGALDDTDRLRVTGISVEWGDESEITQGTATGTDETDAVELTEADIDTTSEGRPAGVERILSHRI